MEWKFNKISFDESTSILSLLKELDRKEITVYTKDGTKYASLYKWSAKFEEIKLDYSSIQDLINYEILEEDSGNFETGEVHYVLSVSRLAEMIFRISNIDSLMPAIRQIRLNKLLN
jgi:hypothetical protein